ncbi:radical SAM protein, partial [[Eubacterium] cellulosolvens]
MHFYVTLTTECNLTCRYCYRKCCDDFGSNFDRFKINYDLPRTISYDLMQLKSFLKKDPKADIIFYGGEPLLELEKMKEIMEQLPDRKYLIQTNGILLDRLEFEYIRRFYTLLISIDGDKTI